MKSLVRKQITGYAGGVIGSGVNARDYHKKEQTDYLANDSLDTVETPLQNESIFSNSKLMKPAVKNENNYSDTNEIMHKSK